MSVNSGLVGQQEMITMLLDNLPAGFTAATCNLPNISFTTPNDAPWLRARIRPETTGNNDACGDRQRTKGIFVIDVFYPLGGGDEAAWTTAELIKASITNNATDNVSLYESHITEVDDDHFYMLQIQTRYAHEGFTKELI